MPSRIDLKWDEKNNQEKGVLQGSFLYQKAAGLFADIISDLTKLKNLDESMYADFCKICGVDLDINTVKMLEYVMLAQA